MATEHINLGKKGSMNIKRGALHEELGVPEGDKIPESKLDSAAKSSNPTLRRRAVLAKTMKGWKHGK
jgi:hypothetical protein